MLLLAWLSPGWHLGAGHASEATQITPIEKSQAVNTIAAEAHIAAADDKNVPIAREICRAPSRRNTVRSARFLPRQTKRQPSAAPADAMLQIEVEHHFSDATASVWVDNRLVYTQSLLGKKQRHGLVFRKVVGHQFQVVRVAPGKHQVRVRVQSTADAYDQSKITSVAFVPGVSLLQNRLRRQS